MFSLPELSNPQLHVAFLFNFICLLEHLAETYHLTIVSVQHRVCYKHISKTYLADQ